MVRTFRMPNLAEGGHWLERCWDLLDSGDVEAAAECADRPNAATGPAAHELSSLRAAIAEAREGPEGAVRVWRDQARRFDADPIPQLELACALDAAADPVGSLAAARRASELAGAVKDEGSLIEATMYIVLALLDLERDDEATRTLEHLLELADRAELPEPSLWFELGLLLAEVGWDAEAVSLLERSIALAPDFADSHYELGRCLLAVGDTDAARAAFLHTLRLDRCAARPGFSPSPTELEALVHDALSALPEHVRTHLRHVPILVEDAPSEEAVADGADPRLLGLFVGTPYPEAGSALPHAPDHIVLYLRNLEAICADADALAQQIRITVWHETGHFFGLGEDELHDIGLG